MSEPMQTTASPCLSFAKYFVVTCPIPSKEVVPNSVDAAMTKSTTTSRPCCRPPPFSHGSCPLPTVSDLLRWRPVMLAPKTHRPSCCVLQGMATTTTKKPYHRFSDPCCHACCGGRQSCGTPAKETRRTWCRDGKGPRGETRLVQVFFPNQYNTRAQLTNVFYPTGRSPRVTFLSEIPGNEHAFPPSLQRQETQLRSSLLVRRAMVRTHFLPPPGLSGRHRRCEAGLV